jgi:hypothetical protein
MANIPQKTKDATEEALNAIQDALNIRAPDLRAGSPLAGADSDAGGSSASDISSDLFQQDVPPTWAAGETSPRRAANDEHECDDPARFAEVAKEKDAALIPFLLAGVGGRRDLNQPDLIHPTTAGHKIIAETVWQIIEPILRKKPTQ